MKTPSVSVVSPIYNDMSSMPQLLPVLVRQLAKRYKTWEIVLIDDGSRDTSREWIRKFVKKQKNVRVFFHANNMGIAKTYRELYARTRHDIVVLFSLDGAWDPVDTIRLADTLAQGGHDIVVGVRERKRYTLWRMIVSTLYNRCTKALFGVDTRDAGSIKAMRRRVIEQIPIRSIGVFDEAERMIRAHKKGYAISYIPVSHAKAAEKKRSGVRIQEVVQAFGDMVRLALHE